MFGVRFSALQRAEIAEITPYAPGVPGRTGFSALQRAEIAEMFTLTLEIQNVPTVSVLFNEPKLLKSRRSLARCQVRQSFSALQRAEIAEIPPTRSCAPSVRRFQCSSTSRNC